ncbi:uncharacterized protein [Procambarus clarkii]|uniref:uncharacterized protein n=1 Tax=Procambarus clarkii TaxID=6728 RepID=UPI001E675106|nr:uncharacterized protein LOC123761637 [Procambarus clarkii]
METSKTDSNVETPQETNELLNQSSMDDTIISNSTAEERARTHLETFDTKTFDLINYIDCDLMASQTPILQGEGCPQPTPEQSSVPGCVNTPTMPDNYANSSARSNALGNTTHTQGQLSAPHIPGTLYSVSTTFQPDHFNSPPQFETLATPTQYTPSTSGDRQESHGATGTDQTLNNAPVEPNNTRSRSQVPFNQQHKTGSSAFSYIELSAEQEVQGVKSYRNFNTASAHTSSIKANVYIHKESPGISTFSQPNTSTLPVNQINCPKSVAAIHVQEPQKSKNKREMVKLSSSFPTQDIAGGSGSSTVRGPRPPAPLSSRKNQRPTKKRKYEQQEPCSDEEEEKKRQGAMRAKKSRDNAQQKRTEQESTIEILEKDNKSLREDNKSLREDNENLHKDNKCLCEVNKSLCEVNKGLREDNKGLREDNKGLREDINILREDNKRLREDNLHGQLNNLFEGIDNI